MSAAHFLMRRRLSLLASGALEGPEREATLSHLEACVRCRASLEALRGVLALVAQDPLRHARPHLPVEALIARVEARLEAGSRPPPSMATRTTGWRWALLPVAAAAVLAVAVLPARRPPTPPVAGLGMSEEALQRLEASVAREQTARYLTEAKDVLVTVASLPRECDRDQQRVDVAAETERSRRLLSRRTLLVESDRAEVASVRPILDDVEHLLREVASLDSCVRRRDVERVRAEMERRQLLMRIRLMTRELEG